MARKTIWIIKLEGDLPSKDATNLGRTSSLAKYLAEKGYDVIWWKSSFHHASHKEEMAGVDEYDVIPNEHIILVHSPIGYKKNISINRILYCKCSANYFKKYSKKLHKPDLILSSWPTISMTEAALAYGEENGVPVLVDVRDRWPDVFERAFPDKLNRLGMFVLAPLRKKTAKLFSKADGMTADVYPELMWACRYAGRTPGELDRAIYLGKERVLLCSEKMDIELSKWKEKGVTDDTWNICFFSTLGSQLDLDTFIDGMKTVCKKYPDIRLIIGGRGDDEDRLKAKYADFPNAFFAGYLNGEQMASMMSISKCGAYCLKNSYGFTDAFSNKVIQYLSGGLPILNSLQGFAKKILTETNSGITYAEGDVEGCAKAIEYLYEHENERQEMSFNAEKLYKDKFDVEIINKQFEEHILKIIDLYNERKKTI